MTHCEEHGNTGHSVAAVGVAKDAKAIPPTSAILWSQQGHGIHRRGTGGFHAFFLLVSEMNYRPVLGMLNLGKHGSPLQVCLKWICIPRQKNCF